MIQAQYQDFIIRSWEHDSASAHAGLRLHASEIIHSILTTYSLPWEPSGAALDVINVEECYLAKEGEFWVIE